MFKVSSTMRWWHLVSPLTQHWHLLDVNLTRLASDLGLTRQKYRCTVHKYICMVRTSERQNLDLLKWILTADQINFIYYNELLKLTKLFIFEKVICQKTIFVFCLKKKTVLSSIYSHYKFFSSNIFTICFYLIKTFGVLKLICFYVQK